MIMAWIRYLVWLKEYFSFSLFVKHIPGSINTLEDSVSSLDNVRHWPEFQAMALQVPCITGLQTSHTCQHYLLHSLDPKDEQQLDHEVVNFRRQAYAPTSKSTFMSLLLCLLWPPTSPSSMDQPLIVMQLSRQDHFQHPQSQLFKCRPHPTSWTWSCWSNQKQLLPGNYTSGN